MSVDEAGQSSSRHIDCQIGIRIRTRRRELGVSQERLAEAVGLTFQQIQKYERGVNRVSASTLWDIATHLETPITYFYDGLDGADHDPEAIARSEAVQGFLLSPEGLDLVLAFRGLNEPSTRKAFVDLIRACSRANSPGDDATISTEDNEPSSPPPGPFWSQPPA